MSSAVTTITFGFFRGPCPVAARDHAWGPNARPAPSAAPPFSSVRRLTSDSTATRIQLHDERLAVAGRRSRRDPRGREVGGLCASGDVRVLVRVQFNGATEIQRGSSEIRGVLETGTVRV